MSGLLVVGGSGYLGRSILDRAIAAGIEVHATHARTEPDRTPGVDWHHLDLRDDAAAVEQLLAALAPAAVVNTAYVQGGEDLEAVTASGAEAVAWAAASIGARMVHISSDVVFDGRLGRPYEEDDPPTPITDYGRAKADAEAKVAAAHPGAALVRTSLLYGGPPGSGAAIGSHERLVLDVLAGRAQVAFFSDEMRCPAQVDDVGAAVVGLALGRPADGVDPVPLAGPVHLVGSERVSRLAFARAIAAAHGADPATLAAATAADRQPPRPLDLHLVSTRPGVPHLRGVSAVFSTDEVGR